MLSAGVLVLLLTIFGSILTLPLGVLAAAFVIFLGEHASWSTGISAVLGLLLISIPASAWLAGVLLDSFSIGLPGARVFSPLALILSCMLLLQSDAWMDALLAAAAPQPATPEFLKAGLSILSSVILAAGLTAFVLSFVPVVFEIPLHWALDDRRIEIRPLLQAVRPLFILVLFAAGFRLFTGLYLHQFDIKTVLAGSL